MRYRIPAFFILVAAAALAVAAFAWWYFCGTAKPAEVDATRRKSVSPVVRTRDDRASSPSAPGARASVRRVPLQPVSELPPLSPEDQRISDELDAVRKSENIKEMSRAVARAAKSANADVRRDAVDVLRLFGRNGMAEATLFMCDDDDDVRNEAFDVWRSALFEFEDDGEKSRHILMVMETVSDREQLDFMTQQIGELSDYHKANTLVTLITGKNAAAREIALREYKDLTGSDFTDVETAQKWLDEQAEPESETEVMENDD